MRKFRYRSVDLDDSRADERADIQDLGLYRDGQFDGVLCSHVLEHVPDDLRAMQELCRIIRQDGWLAVLVPIAIGFVTTREDPAATDARERARLFGQWDHVRLYAKDDFLDRLGRAGFVVIEEYGILQFGKQVFRRHGLAPTSVLYVARRSVRTAKENVLACT